MLLCVMVFIPMNKADAISLQLQHHLTRIYPYSCSEVTKILVILCVCVFLNTNKAKAYLLKLVLPVQKCGMIQRKVAKFGYILNV